MFREVPGQIELARQPLHVGQTRPGGAVQIFESKVHSNEAVASIQPHGGANEAAIDLDNM